MPPNQPGDIVRYEEPERPRHAAVMIVLLTFFELVFVLAFLVNASTSKTPNAQIEQMQWLFMIFFLLGVILTLYRRYFMPDVMVVKVRNKKYEDFIDPNRMPKID